MNFPGFLGNEQVRAALSAAFDSHRFPHALILQGEAGCGKRTLALLIAQALVCRNSASAPCGTCPSCVRSAAGSHPDIRIVEGSGVTRSLTVDAVKAVTADAYRMPEEADCNVYLLFMGQKTSEAAQNKLLKVIEEPPEGAVFILVCESAEQLLPTIRSRTQIFSLKPPALKEAAGFVCKKTGMDEERARQLAQLCGGNIGRMLAEAEGGESAWAAEISAAMASGMMDRWGDALMKAAVPLQKDRALCRETIERLEMIFRDACVLRAGGNTLFSGAPEVADRLSSIPRDRLYRLPELMEEYRGRLERNANMPLLVTCLCASLREAGRGE